jgi:Na+-translocating ferredoxin:NAD+ oxidoreductase subunit B
MSAIVILIFLLLMLLLAYPALRQRVQETPRSHTHRKGLELASILIVLLALFGLFSTLISSVWLLTPLFIAAIGFAVLSRDRIINFPADEAALIKQIDRLLPQTQCGQCNFPGCRPYATAIAQGRADINQCPPGGDEGIKALATLLQRDAKPLNPLHGVHKPDLLAIIREPECIGCTKCIQACPVDAIIGGPKLMHTIIASLCTGCELCIPPCPMDCIDLISITENQQKHIA